MRRKVPWNAADMYGLSPKKINVTVSALNTANHNHATSGPRDTIWMQSSLSRIRRQNLTMCRHCFAAPCIVAARQTAPSLAPFCPTHEHDRKFGDAAYGRPTWGLPCATEPGSSTSHMVCYNTCWNTTTAQTISSSSTVRPAVLHMPIQ